MMVHCSNDLNFLFLVDVVQYGDTALLHASENGHRSIVEMLLDRGADIHHKNKVR